MTTLFLGDVEIPAVTSKSLDEHLANTVGATFAEVWLQHDDGHTLGMLKSDNRALLLFLENPGAVGRTSRSKDDMPRSPIPFQLTNGQMDEYPAAWTIPVAIAVDALRHFCDTGEPAPFIDWSND